MSNPRGRLSFKCVCVRVCVCVCVFVNFLVLYHHVVVCNLIYLSSAELIGSGSWTRGSPGPAAALDSAPTRTVEDVDGIVVEGPSVREPRLGSVHRVLDRLEHDCNTDGGCIEQLKIA